MSIPDNVYYLCGHESIGYFWFQVLVISPRFEHPVFITRISERSSVEITSCLKDARYYRMHFDDPVEMLVEVLKERNLEAATVGVEMHAFNIRPMHWDRMRTLLAESNLVDASLLVLEERLVKSPEEVAYQREAAKIADHAMRAAFAAIQPGISEVKLAGVCRARSRR